MKRISLLTLLLCAVSGVSYAVPPQMGAGADTNSVVFKNGVTEVVKINSTGTVSGATPTANEHFATKEYVDTQTASASGGSSMPTYAGVTSGTFAGNAGLGAMDQACNTQFPGSRMARTSEIARMIAPVGMSDAWVLSDGIESSAYDSGSGMRRYSYDRYTGAGVDSQYVSYPMNNCAVFSIYSTQHYGIYYSNAGSLRSVTCNHTFRALCVIP